MHSTFFSPPLLSNEEDARHSPDKQTKTKMESFVCVDRIHTMLLDAALTAKLVVVYRIVLHIVICNENTYNKIH